MKKLFFLLLVFAMVIPAFAEIKVTGNAPTVSGGLSASAINDETKKAFDKAIEELNDQLKILKNPDKFLQSMANSSVYSSHGATTRGYSGYKLFSATVGPMIGLQLPTDFLSIYNDLDSLFDSLEKDGDIKLGFSPNALNANIGLSMGILKFLPESIGFIKRNNLYVGLRVGYFNLPEIDLGDDSKLNYNNFTFGVTANYQLIPSISLVGLITWRGVNLGSGIIYNRSTLGFGITVDDIRESVGQYDGRNVNIVLKDPKASVNLNTSTCIIPLEANTAIKLLIFNIPFGIGADLSFGKTTLGARADANISFENLSSSYKVTPGNIVANGELSNSPSFFNFKIMTGFGLTAGPVVVDMPITYYPEYGYNFGLTIGVVF